MTSIKVPSVELSKYLWFINGLSIIGLKIENWKKGNIQSYLSDSSKSACFQKNYLFDVVFDGL